MKFLKNTCLSIMWMFLLQTHLQINAKFICLDIAVLLKSSKMKILSRIGMEAIGHLDLQSRFFAFLEHIDDDPMPTPCTTFKGQRLPSNLCKWLKGQTTSQELHSLIYHHIDQNPKSFKFKNNTEKKLFKRAADLFLPKNNVSVLYINNEMLRIIRDLQNKKDRNGKNLNKLIFTCNGNLETFKEFEKQYPEVFNNPNIINKTNRIISGEINTTKPNKEFFDHVMQKFNANPRDVVLLDEEPVTLEAGKKLGMDAVAHKNVGKTRKALKQRKLL